MLLFAWVLKWCPLKPMRILASRQTTFLKPIHKATTKQLEVQKSIKIQLKPMRIPSTIAPKPSATKPAVRHNSPPSAPALRKHLSLTHPHSFASPRTNKSKSKLISRLGGRTSRTSSPKPPILYVRLYCNTLCDHVSSCIITYNQISIGFSSIQKHAPDTMGVDQFLGPLGSTRPPDQMGVHQF